MLRMSGREQQPRVESRLEHRVDAPVGKQQRRAFDGDLTEDEVMDPAQISSITRYELAQTVNVDSADVPRGDLVTCSAPEGRDSKDKARALSDDRAMEFDEEDDEDADRDRDGQ